MDFLQFLVKNKTLERKVALDFLEQAQAAKKTFEEILLLNKAMPEVDLFKLKSQFSNVPFKEMADTSKAIDSKVLSAIPKESVEFYKMVPLEIKEKEQVLEVGMVYPENIQGQEALKFLGRQKHLAVKIYQITQTAFQAILTKYGAPEQEVENALKGLEKEINLGEDAGDLTFSKAQFERLVEEAPVIKMVAVILRQAVDGNASDIHIEPARDKSQVRYRLDGILYPSLFLPLRAHPAIVARIKILSNLKIDETRMPQDGRFSTKVGDRRVDFRVSTFPTTLGEKVVLRVLDPEEGAHTFDQLGLIGSNLKKVEEAAQKPYGMILVTGPTGSGKTTTLYAVLKKLNTSKVNIVTLEDPVEYLMEGISQSQVRPEIDYTFARGLRQILRQDPDIIMVGEIRDSETANLAVHAALTGHLVLSTLHTNSAAGAIARLVDMGIKPFLLPATLAISVSQRLVRRLCQNCRKKIKADGQTKKYILEKLRDLPKQYQDKLKDPIYVYKVVGCDKCKKKGYVGRIGVFETMPMTDALSEIIVKNPSELDIFKQARAEGMTTMIEDGILKVLDGFTTLEEVMRVAEEK